MSVRTRIFLLLALTVLLAGAGCGGDSLALPAETDEPLYREGQQLKKQDRTQEALVSYLKLIAKRGEDQAPESHLEVGLIYLENFKNPIYAIYHFEKYLELEPNSHLAPQVLGEIDRAKLEFARTLPAHPLESQADRMGADDEMAALRTENSELKSELEALRAGATAGTGRFSPPGGGGFAVPVPAAPATAEAPPAEITPAPAAEESATPTLSPAAPVAAPAAAARTHVVVKGDTLYKLAVHYYGSGSRAHQHQISAANRDLLPDENSPLKIGMSLKIP
jgi:LysM repeat protein